MLMLMLWKIFRCGGSIIACAYCTPDPLRGARVFKRTNKCAAMRMLSVGTGCVRGICVRVGVI